MRSSQFWQLIEEARRKAKGDIDRQTTLLRDALAGMSVKEIQSFEDHLRANLRRAYTFDLMAAAFIVMGYVSDDTFEYFRAWLVAQGREWFERAVKAPESIADFLDRNDVQEVQGEALLTCTMAAYEQKTGKRSEDFLLNVRAVDEPVLRQDWPETKAEFRERYPVLFETFWNQERIAAMHAAPTAKPAAKRTRKRR